MDTDVLCVGHEILSLHRVKRRDRSQVFERSDLHADQQKIGTGWRELQSITSARIHTDGEVLDLAVPEV